MYKNEFVFKEFIGTAHNGSLFQMDRHERLSRIRQQNRIYSIKDFLKTVFLPENFPNSVSDDYISYQIWDTVQAFCSSISGALAARAMFESIGVGDDKATAYGATLTWLIKDGTGMTGRILFAWSQGTFLDSNSKMWRLYADILNDFSFFVDLLTPMFTITRDNSIYLMSFSGLLRSIVGIAGGATRSALTQHQAINNNLADVSAKDSSQETLVNLFALIFNIFLLSYLKDSKMLIFAFFVFFVIGHIFANYNAVKAVTIKTFNRNRFHILLQEYFKSDFQITSTKRVNEMEPVLHSCRRYFNNIKLGSSLNDFLLIRNSEFSMDKFNEESYLIRFDIRNKQVCVLPNETSNHSTYLKALFQIELVEFLLENSKMKNQCSKQFHKLSEAIEKGDDNLVEQESFNLVNSLLDDFIKKAKNGGWSFAYTQFSPNVFKYALDKCNKKE